jgi:hypothetical protein
VVLKKTPCFLATPSFWASSMMTRRAGIAGRLASCPVNPRNNRANLTNGPGSRGYDCFRSRTGLNSKVCAIHDPIQIFLSIYHWRHRR